MRKLAFGYSTRCNIRCAHCVADDQRTHHHTMELQQALATVISLASAGVRGISFTAGEPLLYLDDICQLLQCCREHGIYSRVVTNGFWAATTEKGAEVTERLKESGLCQLRMSSSRYHQAHIDIENIIHGARGCEACDLDYFVSFVTDFSGADDDHELLLRHNNIRYFPEPMIYAGRARTFPRQRLFNDYHANRCSMNPYLTPELDLYACCDAGSHFTTTNVFYLGNLQSESAHDLFSRSEQNLLYQGIRTSGLSALASMAGMAASEIVTYRKCDLCKKLFNSPETLSFITDALVNNSHMVCR